MNEMIVYKIVEKLKDKYIKLWWNTDKSFPVFSREISLKEKILGEKRMNKFLDDLFSHLRECPENKDDRENWRTNLWSLIKNFGRASGFTEDEINSDFSKSLPITTHKFICNVKEFHNNVNLDKIVQALRNLWIILQMPCLIFLIR